VTRENLVGHEEKPSSLKSGAALGWGPESEGSPVMEIVNAWLEKALSSLVSLSHALSRGWIQDLRRSLPTEPFLQLQDLLVKQESQASWWSTAEHSRVHSCGLWLPWQH